jgi:hypothetical protein
MGIDITVVLEPSLYKEKKILGEARYPSQTIALDSSMLKGQSLEHNFYHELVHWVFYVLNEDELRNNEKLVDTIAYLIHQSIRTGTDFYTEEELNA